MAPIRPGFLVGFFVSFICAFAFMAPGSAADFYCTYNFPLCCGIKIPVSDETVCDTGRGPGPDCTQYLERFPQDRPAICSLVQDRLGGELCSDMADPCRAWTTTGETLNSGRNKCEICNDKADQLRDGWGRVAQAIWEEREKHGGKLFTDPPDPKPVSARAGDLWEQRNKLKRLWDILREICQGRGEEPGCFIGRNPTDLAYSPPTNEASTISDPPGSGTGGGGGGSGKGQPGGAPNQKTWNDGEQKSPTAFLYPLELWLLEQREDKLRREIASNEQELERNVDQIKAKQNEFDAAKKRNNPSEFDRLARELEVLALEGNALYRHRQELKIREVTLKQEMKSLRNKMSGEGR